MLESAQYGEEARTARGKRKMEGKNQRKNIYLSVFPEILELIEFLFTWLLYIPNIIWYNWPTKMADISILFFIRVRSSSEPDLPITEGAQWRACGRFWVSTLIHLFFKRMVNDDWDDHIVDKQKRNILRWCHTYFKNYFKSSSSRWNMIYLRIRCSGRRPSVLGTS